MAFIAAVSGFKFIWLLLLIYSVISAIRSTREGFEENIKFFKKIGIYFLSFIIVVITYSFTYVKVNNFMEKNNRQTVREIYFPDFKVKSKDSNQSLNIKINKEDFNSIGKTSNIGASVLK
jgi:hypothetical protein